MADDLRQVIEEKTEETKRHFDVVADDLKGHMQQIVEGVTANAQRLDRMEKHLEVLEPMQHDLEAVKVTLQAINLVDLKEQVTDLQKRVAQLEAK